MKLILLALLPISPVVLAQDAAIDNDMSPIIQREFHLTPRRSVLKGFIKDSDRILQNRSIIGDVNMPIMKDERDLRSKSRKGTESPTESPYPTESPTITGELNPTVYPTDSPTPYPSASSSPTDKRSKKGLSDERSKAGKDAKSRKGTETPTESPTITGELNPTVYPTESPTPYPSASSSPTETPQPTERSKAGKKDKRPMDPSDSLAPTMARSKSGKEPKVELVR